MTTPPESYREIPLTKGIVTIVDASDYDWIMRWKWCARWNEKLRGYYAVRTRSRSEGKATTIRMHRVILGLEVGDKRQGDHINRNSLDNRRLNLRIATQAQQSQNRGVQKGTKSGLKGVHPVGSKFRAIISIGGKQKGFPLRNTPDEAHLDYQRAAKESFGEFAAW